jgi:diadenosine tetraphosphate (Ap4A) HIT family hydrolase
VIPRRHAPTLLELTEDEGSALMRAIQRLAQALIAAFDPDGLTIYQNNGVASLQAIPHSHFHVVPRQYGSGWGEGPPHLAAITRADRDKRFQIGAIPIERLAELAERIKARLPLQPS